MNYESTNQYDFQVIATSNGVDISCNLNIKVRNINEVPYWVTTTPIALDVLEHSIAGTKVGDPLVAVDEDFNDSLIYSIVSTEEWFEIDSCSGQISVKKNGISTNLPNVEYTFNVSVRDSSGLDAGSNIEVTVKVVNVNDPPSFVLEECADFVYHVRI